jgi:uncharacterized repeat protein (TIGR01451 family)
MINDQLSIINYQSQISHLTSPIPHPPSRPAGLASPLRSGETVNVTLGTLNPGQEVTIEFQVTIDDPTSPANLTQVCNQGQIAGTGFNVSTDDPDVGGVEDPTCTTIPRPDLTAMKTNDTGGAGAVGVPFDWTIAISNSGPGSATFTATQVILRDNLPTGATYGIPTVMNDSGVTNSGNISCSIVSNELECVAGGGSVTVTGGGSFDVVFAVTPTTPGDLVNPTGGVCRVDPDEVEAETDENNNDCSDTVTVPGPDLTATKTNDTGGIGAVSIPFTWTINTSNSGAADAIFDQDEVILTDNLPSGADYGTPTVLNASGVANSGSISCDISGNELECTASGSSVTIGSSGSFEVVFTVTPTAVGDLVNPTGGICEVDPAGTIVEDIEDNNECSDMVSVQAVDLQISKDDGGVTVEPGETIIYTLTYTNAGSLTANNTFITETVPANTTFNDASSTGGWSCADGSPAGTTCLFPLGSLPGGSGATVDFAVDVVNPIPAGVEQIENTAMIGDDGSKGPDANSADNTAGDVTPVDAAPDLQISKDDGGVIGRPGETISYTLTYTNAGNQDAAGVTISDTVPANTGFNAGASTGGWSCADGSPAGTVCELFVGSLAGNGGSGSVVFAVQVDEPLALGVTQVENTAEIFDDGNNGPDANPADNTATDVTEVRGGAIRVEKATNGFDADTAPGPNIPNGDPVVWTYEIENTGNVPLNSIQLDDDQLPPFTCDEGAIPNLESGESFTCTTGDVAGLGQYENQATVTAQAPAGYEVSDQDTSHYFGIDPMNWAFQCSTIAWTSRASAWAILTGSSIPSRSTWPIRPASTGCWLRWPGGPTSI